MNLTLWQAISFSSSAMFASSLSFSCYKQQRITQDRSDELISDEPNILVIHTLSSPLLQLAVILNRCLTTVQCRTQQQQ